MTIQKESKILMILMSITIPIVITISGYVYAKTIENGERISKVEENCYWIREEFRHIRSDIKNMKEDLKEDLKSIKDDVRKVNGSVRLP